MLEVFRLMLIRIQLKREMSKIIESFPTSTVLLEEKGSNLA